jgi:hypothetical protein
MVKPQPTHLSLPDEDVSMLAVELWLAGLHDAAAAVALSIADEQLDAVEVKHDGDAKKIIRI